MKNDFKNLLKNIDFELLTGLLEITPSIIPENNDKIKQRIMQRISQKDKHQYFIFNDTDQWTVVGDGMTVKILQKDSDSKSFLLKLSPNTIIPYHEHSKNEETLVIDGEVWLDGIYCKPGDYHFSSIGTFHKEIRTEQGCTLFIKSY